MNNYFYLDHHNQQQGPISPERFAENGVTPNSLVWCTGMADWAPAYTVPELKAFSNQGAVTNRLRHRTGAMLTAMRPITRMVKCTISRIRTEEMRSAAANMAATTITVCRRAPIRICCGACWL